MPLSSAAERAHCRRERLECLRSRLLSPSSDMDLYSLEDCSHGKQSDAVLLSVLLEVRTSHQVDK